MLRLSRTGLVLAIVALLVSTALVLAANATADAQQYDTYVVKEGDVLARIASTYKISVGELMELNNLTSPILIRRQVLKVPALPTKAAPVIEEMATEEAAAEEMATEAATEEAMAEATEAPAAQATVEAPAVETTAQPEGAPASGAATGAPVTASEAVTETATEEAAAEGMTTEEAAEEAMGEPVAAVDAWAAPESGVQVFSPAAGGAYHSPMDISGLVGALEGDIVVRLIDGGEDALAERTVSVHSPESAGFFNTYLRFDVSDPAPATLEITVGSAEPVEVPVILLPGQRFIDLNLPADGAAVCSPIVVAGYSSTFEANVVVEIAHADGTQLVQEPTTGGSLGRYSEFSIALDQSVDEPHPLIIAVYESDASGMYPSVDRAAVPVTLYPAGSAACP